MTLISIKKTALWLLASLTLINFVILLTIAYYWFSRTDSIQIVKDDDISCSFRDCPADCDSITFNKYSNFKSHYRNRTSPLLDSMRELRFAMIDELNKDNPDTIKLNKLAEQSGAVYVRLRKKTINQLMQMKDSFPPEFRGDFMRKCGRNKDMRDKKLRRHKSKNIKNKELKHHRIGSCRKY